MRVNATKEFVAWLNSQDPNGDHRRLTNAALRFLSQLPTSPREDLPPTLKRVRQARRHPIWRVSHPYHPNVAIRVLCWFPTSDVVVVALVGGDKVRIGDDWYDSASARAEALVDLWLQAHPTT